MQALCMIDDALLQLGVITELAVITQAVHVMLQGIHKVRHVMPALFPA